MSHLPSGFVYLTTVDSTIQHQLRYCTSNNFIGRPIDGYVEQRVIVTEAAAIALSQVQQEVLKDGYCLVIYDSYRPQKAVNHFAHWSKDPLDDATKAVYYPTIDKKDVFDLGYVAEKSGHSRGSTIDLTIISVSKVLREPELGWRTLEDGSTTGYLDDNTVDMGSSFDLLDELSGHACQRISTEQAKNRRYLLDKMSKYGFEKLDEEWWHYSLKDEPFPNTFFDFDVK